MLQEASPESRWHPSLSFFTALVATLVSSDPTINPYFTTLPPSPTVPDGPSPGCECAGTILEDGNSGSNLDFYI